ncbi:met-10 domain-containing protein, putative [Eimeria maxima]|uniref:tRNA (guanine(37)-N1)-methyltransferase n=1 Tax=Eimeria maxima TaxID=5804 RepID=U6M5D1_EIMMA|nr:met-10 domain-containing protein, putative [Eimeria maxima]CDJ59442.1 met-10 domain-containing protein, putative [Eimeria maxima]
MSPGCLSAQGDLAVADTPAAAEACAPGEETAPEPSTDVPFGKIAAGAPAAMESDAFVHLDKTVFNKYEDVTCLRVPLHQLQELSKALRKYLFKRRNVRPIILDILESSQKGGPQRESQREQLEAAQQEEQPEEEMEKQKKAGKVLNVAELEGLPESLQSLLKETDIQVLRHRVFLGYENLSVVECLAALLPEGVETPHRFECVGHIAHLNLPSSLLKFKYAIGQVILDKHPQLRTVVLKTGIGSKWRELQFELIAGEAAYVAKVKEADLVFEVDYAKAFWNSRYSGEVGAEAVGSESQAVAAAPAVDAFAGVGAFAVFLARTGCVVAANDGNPSSAASMQANVKRNGVANLVDVHNQDARDFLRSQAQPAAIAALQRKRLQAGGTPSNAKDAIARKVEYRSAVEVHVLMNLPELAIEFLDVFPGLLAESEPQPKRHCPDGEALSSKAAGEVTPQVSRWRVHCYAFCRDPRPEQELKISDLQMSAESRRVFCRSCVSSNDSPLPYELQVRDVAPNKQMYCLAFDLPPDVLYGERGSTTRRAGAEPAPH